MTRAERNRDLCNVSPHMETIRGYKLPKTMNGMGRGYWTIILIGVLLFAVWFAMTFKP